MTLKPKRSGLSLNRRSFTGKDVKPRKSAIESKSPAMKSSEQATGKPASRLIDQRIRDMGGWRGETLARMRALILEADPR